MASDETTPPPPGPENGGSNLDLEPGNGGLDNGGLEEDFEGGRGDLATTWRDNPMVKAGIVVGVLVVLIGGIILFGSGDKKPETSRMVGGTELTEPPGTSQVSQVYSEAVKETDAKVVEEAIRTGGSAIPTPITPPVGRVTLPDEDTKEDDPLERWRRIQEERQRRIEEKPATPQGDPNLETISRLAEAMAAQMESILQSKKPMPPRYALITPGPEFVMPGEEDLSSSGGNADGGGEDDGEDVVKIIVPAGTIEYAQLLIEADSDIPGPIMARIASGPLAGSRILGAFTVADGEYLVLNFDTVVIDGISHGIDAVAVNPDTTKIGMVTDVDHKYWERIILPAAAKFIEGFGSAVAQTDSTSVSVSGGTGTVTQETQDLNARQELFKGVEEASKEISDIISEEGKNAKVRIVVKAGTPMGVLFLKPVTPDDERTAGGPPPDQAAPLGAEGGFFLGPGGGLVPAGLLPGTAPAASP